MFRGKEIFIQRVLSAGGIFIIISNSKPEQRKEFLDKPEYKWRYETTVLRTINFNFM